MDSSEDRSGQQSATASESEPQYWCPICKTMVSDRALTDTCGHQFCLDCLKQWSADHNSCPICRQTYHKILTNFRQNGVCDEIPVRSPVHRLIRTMNQMVADLEELFVHRLQQLKESILSVELSLQQLKGMVRQLEADWVQTPTHSTDSTLVTTSANIIDTNPEPIAKESDRSEQNSRQNEEISDPKPKKLKTDNTSTDDKSKGI